MEIENQHDEFMEENDKKYKKILSTPLEEPPKRNSGFKVRKYCSFQQKTTQTIVLVEPPSEPSN